MALLSSIRRAFQDSLDVYLLEAVKTKDLTKIHQIVMDQVPDIPPNAMNPARLMYLALANKKFDLAQEIYTTFVGYAIDDYVEYNDEGECVGWTALHFAVDNKNRKAVKFLLKRGADVNCKNEEKDQPINLAVDNKDIKITRLLLSYGADKRHCQNWLVTPDNKRKQSRRRNKKKIILVDGPENGYFVNFKCKKRGQGLGHSKIFAISVSKIF
ncbi:putative ankyrin repeat protein RF_0381 isoform X2 [Microplitis mediator]|uniref:putative ankyrin repeat protein RF_0381 isoform X2 n=1 Tax=Microplitis mediator TaxID=375433 RepID=UPI0025543E77|nr:putative ankyrin repeat protein RF_0381 isoform X2 [Microplitis mediator]